MLNDEKSKPSTYSSPLRGNAAHQEADPLLFASPESATGAVCVTEMLDDALRGAVMDRLAARDALPRTLSAALADDRPVVVTSADRPYEVVDVNAAWTGLCGYSREEALRIRDVGVLLAGPDTDPAVGAILVRDLRRDSFAQAVLTNYTKDGRKFRNRVTVGVLAPAAVEGREDSSGLCFVGVLEDLDATGDNRVAVSMG
jgi:PAS domain-containing protein